jgi:hypothetical protein
MIRLNPEDDLDQFQQILIIIREILMYIYSSLIFLNFGGVHDVACYSVDVK